eukprot:scpid29852/ scgid11209/ 
MLDVGLDCSDWEPSGPSSSSSMSTSSSHHALNAYRARPVGTLNPGTGQRPGGLQTRRASIDSTTLTVAAADKPDWNASRAESGLKDSSMSSSSADTCSMKPDADGSSSNGSSTSSSSVRGRPCGSAQVLVEETEVRSVPPPPEPQCTTLPSGTSEGRVAQLRKIFLTNQAGSEPTPSTVPPSRSGSRKSEKSHPRSAVASVVREGSNAARLSSSLSSSLDCGGNTGAPSNGTSRAAECPNPWHPFTATHTERPALASLVHGANVPCSVLSSSLPATPRTARTASVNSSTNRHGNNNNNNTENCPPAVDQCSQRSSCSYVTPPIQTTRRASLATATALIASGDTTSPPAAAAGAATMMHSTAPFVKAGLTSLVQNSMVSENSKKSAAHTKRGSSSNNSGGTRPARMINNKRKAARFRASPVPHRHSQAAKERGLAQGTQSPLARRSVVSYPLTKGMQQQHAASDGCMAQPEFCSLPPRLASQAGSWPSMMVPLPAPKAPSRSDWSKASRSAPATRTNTGQSACLAMGTSWSKTPLSVASVLGELDALTASMATVPPTESKIEPLPPVAPMHAPIAMATAPTHRATLSRTVSTDSYSSPVGALKPLVGGSGCSGTTALLQHQPSWTGLPAATVAAEHDVWTRAQQQAASQPATVDFGQLQADGGGVLQATPAAFQLGNGVRSTAAAFGNTVTTSFADTISSLASSAAVGPLHGLPRAISNTANNIGSNSILPLLPSPPDAASMIGKAASVPRPRQHSGADHDAIGRRVAEQWRSIAKQASGDRVSGHLIAPPPKNSSTLARDAGAGNGMATCNAALAQPFVMHSNAAAANPPTVSIADVTSSGYCTGEDFTPMQSLNSTWASNIYTGASHQSSGNPFGGGASGSLTPSVARLRLQHMHQTTHSLDEDRLEAFLELSSGSEAALSKFQLHQDLATNDAQCSAISGYNSYRTGKNESTRPRTCSDSICVTAPRPSNASSKSPIYEAIKQVRAKGLLLDHSTICQQRRFSGDLSSICSAHMHASSPTGCNGSSILYDVGAGGSTLCSLSPTAMSTLLVGSRLNHVGALAKPDCVAGQNVRFGAGHAEQSQAVVVPERTRPASAARAVDYDYGNAACAAVIASRFPYDASNHGVPSDSALPASQLSCDGVVCSEDGNGYITHLSAADLPSKQRSHPPQKQTASVESEESTCYTRFRATSHPSDDVYLGCASRAATTPVELGPSYAKNPVERQNSMPDKSDTSGGYITCLPADRSCGLPVQDDGSSNARAGDVSTSGGAKSVDDFGATPTRRGTKLYSRFRSNLSKMRRRALSEDFVPVARQILPKCPGGSDKDAALTGCAISKSITSAVCHSTSNTDMVARSQNSGDYLSHSAGAAADTGSFNCGSGNSQKLVTRHSSDATSAPSGYDMFSQSSSNTDQLGHTHSHDFLRENNSAGGLLSHGRSLDYIFRQRSGDLLSPQHSYETPDHTDSFHSAAAQPQATPARADPASEQKAKRKGRRGTRKFLARYKPKAGKLLQLIPGIGPADDSKQRRTKSSTEAPTPCPSLPSPDAMSAAPSPHLHQRPAIYYARKFSDISSNSLPEIDTSTAAESHQQTCTSNWATGRLDSVPSACAVPAADRVPMPLPKHAFRFNKRAVSLVDFPAVSSTQRHYPALFDSRGRPKPVPPPRSMASLSSEPMSYGSITSLRSLQ